MHSSAIGMGFDTFACCRTGPADDGPWSTANGILQTVLPAAASLVLLFQVVPSCAQRGQCRLTSLCLRSGNQPIDLKPCFAPDIYHYDATLDFAMDSVSADVVPAPGSVTDGVPIHAIPVQRGGVHQLIIYAKSPGCHQAYTVKVKRLNGSETEVSTLRIDGAILQPDFWHTVREYTAQLPLDQELVRIMYVLQDNGQKVRCRSMPQLVGGNSRSNNASQHETRVKVPKDISVASHHHRSLLAFGETQRPTRYQAFPIDVGCQRTVVLTVESADPLGPDTGVYTVDVTRAACSLAKPLYDTESQTCVINCPARHYPNLLASRCSECNTNCAVCRSLAECDLCREDGLHRSYRMQPDGSCIEVESDFRSEYYWWCISLGIVMGLLLCLGLVQFCQCLCTCCCPWRDRYSHDSESDLD